MTGETTTTTTTASAHASDCGCDECLDLLDAIFGAECGGAILGLLDLADTCEYCGADPGNGTTLCDDCRELGARLPE